MFKKRMFCCLILAGLGLFLVLSRGIKWPETGGNPGKVVVSELQRVDIQIGKGNRAEVGTSADIRYTERTARGQIVSVTGSEKLSARVTVTAHLDPGAPIGYFIEGMRVGGHRRVTLPWGKDYGNSHASGEPLIYELDLDSVN